MIENAAFIIGLFSAWSIGAMMIYLAGAWKEEGGPFVPGLVVGCIAHAGATLALVEFVVEVNL